MRPSRTRQLRSAIFSRCSFLVGRGKPQIFIGSPSNFPGRDISLMPVPRLAQSLFGHPAWPNEVTVPQAWIEFEVEDIEAATKELEDRGYDLLVRAREEPWGQVLTRLLAPGGLMVGIVRNPLIPRSRCSGVGISRINALSRDRRKGSNHAIAPSCHSVIPASGSRFEERAYRPAL